MKLTNPVLLVFIRNYNEMCGVMDERLDKLVGFLTNTKYLRTPDVLRQDIK